MIRDSFGLDIPVFTIKHGNHKNLNCYCPQIKYYPEANRIIVINQEQIEQRGSHEKLVEIEGMYKKFVQRRQRAVNMKFV